MKRTLLVARREFLQRVRTRGFLIATLLTPLVLLAVGYFARDSATEAQTPAPIEEPAAPSLPMGYVDQAGLIQLTPDDMPPDLFQPFAAVAAADAALAGGSISAYYVIAPDYRQTGAVHWIGESLPLIPPSTVWIDELLRANLLAGVDPALRAQVEQPFNAPRPRLGSEMPDAMPDEATTAAEDGLTFLPLIVTLVIVMPLFTGGGYLFQSLVQEKSSRVMEILLLSLQPQELLTGKLLGLGALVLVQYLLWLAIGLIGLAALSGDLSGALASVQLTDLEIVLLVLYALGGYALYAALMAGMGALTPDMESNRAWIFLISLPMLIPIYLWTAIVGNPNGPLAVTLSLIPFSAPVAMLMRITVDAVPLWQVAISLLLLAVTVAATIWGMARLFRAQTLLSGEAFSIRRLWGGSPA